MSATGPAGLATGFVDVSDEKLLATVALIDRLPERGAIDALIAPLRPRLQRLQPPRPMTLRRVLTLPLEQLLVSPDEWRPGSLGLSRDFLGTIHGLVLEGLAPALGQATERALTGRTMDDTAQVQHTGAELWPAAAEILRRALAQAPAMSDGRGRHRRQQLEMAAELLGIGVVVCRAFAALPMQPVRHLAEDHYAVIGELMTALEDAGGRALALGCEALGRRLGDPAVLLLALQRTAAASARRLAVAADAAKRAVAELDDSADRLRRAGRAPALALAAAVARLVGTLAALEAAPADLPVDRARLKQIRLKTAKAVEGHLARVVTGEVLDGFRALADPSAAEAQVDAAEASARAAHKLGAAGRQLGAAGQIDLVVERALEDFRRALAQTGSSGHDNARLMDQLRIVEIVFGAETAAELLMSRHQGALPRVG